jgi:hypothetical protein
LQTAGGLIPRPQAVQAKTLAPSGQQEQGNHRDTSLESSVTDESSMTEGAAHVKASGARFHGMLASSMPMAQESVIPANTKPMPTKPEINRNHGLMKAPKAIPKATSEPATMRTWRSMEIAFRPRSTLKSNRSLFTPGGKLKAGRYGKNLCRRRPTETLVLTKPPGKVRYHFVDAGWLEVSRLGSLHGVFSRKGTARKILGLVTDALDLSAAGLIRIDEKRWTIEPFVQDAKQLLGLGQYQDRSYRAAVIHLHLVCFADALLTHLRLERTGAQGHRTRDNAAGMSVAAAQETLRGLIWDDLLTCLQEKRHSASIIVELERLQVA